MKADRQATEAKQFFDPRSYVAKDGREILFGLDWKQRIGELRKRSGGRCEWRIAFGYTGSKPIVERCAREAADPDHIVKRSVKRDDRLENLQALCKTHHTMKHPEKQLRSGKVVLQ